ncbi:MAG TPA: PepSY-associated TM helix domain-containing protein, partial [Vicinamibacterales bacterium]|nr:PepSY-associated TM helix domain-containing protein [Vicinamibacterales bacterium]
SVYVDQYSGTVIEVDEQRASAGDRMTRAIAPLHVGAFGGTLIRSVWFVFGLAPSFLALTGAIIYFRRGTR